MKDLVYDSLCQLEAWVERNEYKGYEPFDGLNSFLTPVLFNNLFAERVLQQVVRQSAVSIRSRIGIRPQGIDEGARVHGVGLSQHVSPHRRPDLRRESRSLPVLAD